VFYRSLETRFFRYLIETRSTSQKFSLSLDLIGPLLLFINAAVNNMITVDDLLIG